MLYYVSHWQLRMNVSKIPLLFKDLQGNQSKPI